jgi:hypothetical protein
MKTNSTQFKKQVFNYILDCIDLENYTRIGYTHEGKVNRVYEIFKDEYYHNIKYYKNEQELFESYLSGLPSCINIDFENHEILKLAKIWGSIPEDATEDEEDLILGNWFNFISVNFFQLRNKLKNKSNLPKQYKIQTEDFSTL